MKNNLSVNEPRLKQFVGELIEKEYAQELILKQREFFPSMISSFIIPVSILQMIREDSVNISGIRFMYAMEEAGNPKSAMLLLMPCNTTSMEKAIPNAIVQPLGYFNHKGERISLKKTWEYLYNHAVYMSQQQSSVPFRKIVRGAFLGIESLHSLMYEYSNSNSLLYNFGYDSEAKEGINPHKPVLIPLDFNGNRYDIFMDNADLCPPNNCDSPDSCLATITAKTDHELNMYRTFRDDFFLSNIQNGPLVEMYYYISPALTEAIAATGRAEEIYHKLYQNEFVTCNRLLADGKYPEVKLLFEQTMHNLMQQYLWSK